MERRNDVPDLHYLVVTINLQSGTGGNLAEILSNLASVIRDRYRMYKKVRALSAEGRLSAVVIAFVPFFVVGVMWFNSPEYYLEAAEHKAFPVLLGFGVVLYFFSMFVIHRIVNFKV
jgi:tight adherence protein B